MNLRVRSRAAAFGAAGVTAVIAVLLSATPAWACTLAVSGTTSCVLPNQSDHVVNWTIHNNEAAANRPMTIVSATATINGTQYPVTGFTTNLPPLGTTTATTNVPASVPGAPASTAAQIKLTVRATWPDNNKNEASTIVTLLGTCPSTTTTPPPTTAPNSPQNHGTTPTTQPASSVSSLPPGSGVEAIQGGPTTTATSAPSGAQLPFTGNATTIYALFGIALFVGGILLVKSSKEPDALDGADER